MDDKKYAKELSYISKCSGSFAELVQAGGGNTSVKTDDRYMLIKASGYHLTDVTEDSGYSVVDHKYISDVFADSDVQDSDEQQILQKALCEGRKPSIETFLHSVTKKYTIHTHPLSVGILAAKKEGMEELKRLFPQAVMVDYATPGIRLAKTYCRAMKQAGDSDVVFLKNHGLIVSADSADAALKLQTDTIIKVMEYLKMDTSGFTNNMRVYNAVHSTDPTLSVCRISSPAVTEAAEISGGQWDYMYSPDCIVYCGNRFLVLNDRDDFCKQLLGHAKLFGMPKIIVSGRNVYASAPNAAKAAEIGTVLDFTAKIYLKGKVDGFACDLLPKSECDFLLGWDSEKYRSSLGK